MTAVWEEDFMIILLYHVVIWTAAGLMILINGVANQYLFLRNHNPLQTAPKLPNSKFVHNTLKFTCGPLLPRPSLSWGINFLYKCCGGGYDRKGVLRTGTRFQFAHILVLVTKTGIYFRNSGSWLLGFNMHFKPNFEFWEKYFPPVGYIRSRICMFRKFIFPRRNS